MSDLRARQHLNRGFGEAFGRGIDLALVPVFAGGIGWIVDHFAGTSPTFTLAFAIFGVVGIIAKMWLGYDKEMREHEEQGAWSARAARSLGNGPALWPDSKAAPVVTDEPKVTPELDPTGNRRSADADGTVQP